MKGAELRCDARVLLWLGAYAQDGEDGIAICQRPAGHDGLHEGRLEREVEIEETGEKHSPLMVWMETDRRTFRGELVMCEFVGCTLPKGHRGDHAL